MLNKILKLKINNNYMVIKMTINIVQNKKKNYFMKIYQKNLISILIFSRYYKKNNLNKINYR